MAERSVAFREGFVRRQWRTEWAADCDWHRIGRDGGIDSLCTSADLAGQH